MAGNIGGYIAPAGGGGGGGSTNPLIDSTLTAGEIISGATFACAVALTQSGLLQTAMAAVSGRMPGVGVVVNNVASGGVVTMYRGGDLFSTAFNFSGWMNQPVYIGRSGQLNASGPPISSGDIQQIMGVSENQSGMLIQIGDPLEPVIAQSGDIGSGAVTGQMGGGYLCVASGSLGTNDTASGMVTWGSMGVTPINSGINWGIAPLITEEIISGIKAVCVSQSGHLRVAMASVSGRMPAIGVALDNVLSGLPVNVYTQGAFQLGSGMADYSGYLCKMLFVGRSGQLVTSSGSFNSGGLNLASGGDFVQKMGLAFNSGALILNTNLDMNQTILLGTTSLTDVTNRGFGL